MTNEHVALSVADGTRMDAYVAHPANENDTHCGVLVIQEIFGVNHHIRSVTDRFAQAGYRGLAPDLFHRTAPNFQGRYDDLEGGREHAYAMTAEGIEADLRAAHGWLDEHCRDHRVVVLGFCMGGAISVVANAILPVKCAVSYYGSPGHVSKILGEGFADRLRVPQLFYWGGLDPHIDRASRAEYVEAIRKAGKRFVDVEFSFANHGFNCDERASYDPEAAAESWQMTLAFLRQHCG